MAETSQDSVVAQFAGICRAGAPPASATGAVALPPFSNRATTQNSRGLPQTHGDIISPVMPRRLLLFPLLIFALAAQSEPPASPKIIERYKQMLAANPVEGTALDRLWQAYRDAGKTGELIDEYKAGGSFASELIAGHFFKKAGRNDDAAAAFQRAAQLAPESPLPLLALARVRLETGHPAEAADLFEKAAAHLPATDSKSAETLLQVGAAWLAAGEVEKASAAWERTISVDPGNLGLRHRLAETYAQNHLGDRAIPHLDFLKTHAPPAERAQALQQLARIHQGAGRQDEAIAALDEALAGAAPGNWLRGELESQLIRLHQRCHRTSELEERWKKVAQENPRDLGAQLQLIGFYERLGDLDQELAWLEKLTALAPKSAEYRLRLARLHAQMDHLDSAAPIFDQLLKEQPTNAELVFERARIDVQRDAVPAARARIAGLLLTRPSDETLRRKALEFFETHRLNDATEELLKADAASGSEEPLLALANFYFAHKRDADARRELDRLVRETDPADRQAAAYFRIAEISKDQNDAAGAAAAVTAAVSLRPDSRDLFLLLGDLESARGRHGEARAACEKAFALSRTPAEQLEADQKLFESIRSSAIRVGTEIPSRPATTGRGSDEGAASPELEDYLLKLTRDAAANPTVENWLRIARWQSWNRSPRVAQECAQQALVLDPRSMLAHEFLVQLGMNDPRSPLPLAHLDELMKLDPAGRAGYQRRAAEVQLQSGRAEDALRLFSELAGANPGDVGALTDLALAQQRAERWKESLGTWRQIFALTPPARRKESTGALMRIYERLEMPQEAAALLLQQIDAQTEEKEAFALFQELLTHCAKHRLTDWLRGEFEQRHKLRADDYFTAMSLGRILKTLGDKTGAFELLADASFAAPNQAQALPELVREAEDLHKLDAAIRLQAQLVRIVPQTRSDGFEKLARLQENAFQTEAAAKTWERLALRFPRDAAALLHAVEFQLKWGTPPRAVELLRRIRALEPGNVRALATLAELDAESGATAEAEQCLEEILRHSPPEKSGDPIRFPSLKPEDAGRLQNAYLSTVKMRGGKPTAEALRALRSFWVEEPAGAKPESDLPLRAIRDLARCVVAKSDPAALAQWVARWRNSAEQSPGEALWALFHAGASGPLLDLVERLMGRKEIAAQAKQAFIWFALQTGEFDRLAAWLHDAGRSTADRDYLFVALAEYLQINGGRPDPALLEKLFPRTHQTRLWQAAITFANRAHFREATQLGQRIFDTLTTQRPGYGLELAHWYLYLGDADAARRVLRASIDGAGEAFEAPVYHALREYFLLLPEAERGSFAAGFLRRLDPAKPVHAAICGALLHGLAGEESAAREQLHRLLELRPISQIADDDTGNSASRYWNFVLDAGVQLQEWKLDSLARFLWENALADEALIRLQTNPRKEQVGARVLEIRTRLAAMKMIRATALEAEALSAEYARASGMEGLLPLAEALDAMGAQTQSIAIFRRLWEREPANPHALRNLLNACRTAGDAGTTEQVLTRCVRDGFFAMNDAANRDLTLQLVDALESRGNAAQARAVLDQCIERSTRDSRLLLRLAQLHEHAGRLDLAESVYRKVLGFEAANAGARVALAAVLEAQGRVPAAIDLLEKSSAAETDPRLAQLYLQAGRMEDAFAAMERLPASNHVAATLLFAERLAQIGELQAARSSLRNALAKAPDARAGFPLQTRLIELLTPADDRGVIMHELRRLRRMAGDDVELLDGYFGLALRQVSRLGLEKTFASELADEWDEGAGSLVAGVALLEWRLARGDPRGAEAVCARLLADRNLTEAGALKVTQILTDAARPELAVAARERLARLNPLDSARMLEWALALNRLGRRAEAVRVLEELGARAVFEDEVAGNVAQAFAECGATDRARALFEQAITGDPGVRRYRVFLDYARLLTAQGELARAAKALRIGFRNMGNREYGEIVAFLKATGRLERFDDEIGKFLSEPERIAAARHACLSEQAKSGPRGIGLAVAQQILMELGR